MTKKTDMIEEGGDAASTLVPKNSTKTEMLSQMLKVVGSMKREDLSKFLTTVLNQVGKEDETVPNNAAKNAATVAGKGIGDIVPTSSPYSVKEDIEGLFADSEDLSEEFKSNATTLFEAAVSNRVMLETARIQEELEAEYDDKLIDAIDEIQEQVSSYIDHVASEWMKKNEVAVVNNIRAEHTERFIKGLKQLFAESYIDAPDEQLDLVGELQETVDELKEKLEDVLNENIKLTKTINESKMDEVFARLTEGLTDTQVEKMKVLSENVESENIEDYEDRLKVIRDKYFTEEDESNSTGLISEESAIGENTSIGEGVKVPADMLQYMTAISRTAMK